LKVHVFANSVALHPISLRIQSISSERASADAEVDTSGSEAASESAALIPDFDAYLNSAAAEASATASAKSDVAAFAEALVDVERLGRLKLPNVWDVISKYPPIVQPVLRIISCLPCTQASVERIFSHVKIVLRENRVRMGNESTQWFPTFCDAFLPLLILELFIPPLWNFHSSSVRVRKLILTIMVFIEDNHLIQRGPTTFDLQAILQKRDNSRATSNKTMYKTTDSKYLKLKG